MITPEICRRRPAGRILFHQLKQSKASLKLTYVCRMQGPNQALQCNLLHGALHAAPRPRASYFPVSLDSSLRRASSASRMSTSEMPASFATSIAVRSAFAFVGPPIRPPRNDGIAACRPS